MTKKEHQCTGPHSDHHADTVEDPPAKAVLSIQQDMLGVQQNRMPLEGLPQWKEHGGQ